jgi:lipopolysaccharide transport system ATP-binding protein
MSTAITFENISKQYRLGLVSTKTISHDLNRWWQTSVRGKEDPYLKIGEVNDRSTKGTSDYVWALRDISFDVQQGDVLGIIGKNGAGKSTLLKILSKVTTPTTGTIKAKGRIASLLEVGTGFHPELTGRENIYMNGAIMGMTKREIDRKLDEIVDFSGVERYLDTPTKRYSSGMTVRLGFAIAAHLDPEILVVDEVLAVGDAEFQKKAIGKMQDISRGEGRTVLFVSHNMKSVQQLCNKGVVLENGSVSFAGNIEDTIDRYLKVNESSAQVVQNEKTYQNEYKTKINSITLLNARTDAQQSSFKMGDDIKVRIVFDMQEKFDDLSVNLRMNDVYGVGIAGWRTREMGIKMEPKGKEMQVDVIIKNLNVFDGFYNLSLSLTHQGERNTVVDFVESMIAFEIIPAEIELFGNIIAKSHNLIYTPAQWTIN